MSRVNYHEYIASDAWRKRRAAYFKNRRKRCRACHARKQIHLHHATYERLGAELDQDLVPLCAGCHKRVHAHHKEVGGSLMDATDHIIQVVAKERTRVRTYETTRKPPGRSDPVNNALKRVRRRKAKKVLKKYMDERERATARGGSL